MKTSIANRLHSAVVFPAPAAPTNATRSPKGLLGTAAYSDLNKAATSTIARPNGCDSTCFQAGYAINREITGADNPPA
jgi:hypothetical protein